MINTKYFELTPNNDLWPYWLWRHIHHETLGELDGRMFCNFLPRIEMNESLLSVEVEEQGQYFNFNFSTEDVIIVEPMLAQLISDFIANPTLLECIPIKERNHGKPYVILTVHDSVECMDYEKSNYQWNDVNSQDPLKKPKLFAIYDLKIDPLKAQGHHFFTMKESKSYLIVSQQFKEFLELAGATGLKFTPVC